jgi:2-aminoadipate transaminase
MRVDVLAERLAAGLRPRLVHTVSSFHNPRGVTLAPDRRRVLAELADRYGFLVVEDDPYGLLAFDGAPARPVAAHGDRVLRLGSASKIVAPALRVGWLTGPPTVVAAVERLKQGTDLCGSSLTQAIAAELLADTGWLDAHLTRTRAVTAARARAFTAAVADRLPAVTCTTPTGGMFCWLEFPAGIDTTELLSRALAAGVAFVPGSAFAVHADQTRAARCCYASVDEATLAEAVARLASCVSSAGSTAVSGSIA